MKVPHILLAMLLLFSCQPNDKPADQKKPTLPPTLQSDNEKEKVPSRWDLFWLTFQKAVKEGDVETIAKYIVFPLPGSEPLNDGRAISKATFEAHFNNLFDAKAVEVFSTSAGNFSDFITKNKVVAQQLNIPVNVMVRAITVFYVFDEGTDRQTESSLTFHFAETSPDVFKLVSIIAAG